jgi:hypothetical protein
MLHAAASTSPFQLPFLEKCDQDVGGRVPNTSSGDIHDGEGPVEPVIGAEEIDSIFLRRLAARSVSASTWSGVIDCRSRDTATNSPPPSFLTRIPAPLGPPRAGATGPGNASEVGALR